MEGEEEEEGGRVGRGRGRKRRKGEEGKVLKGQWAIWWASGVM